jgi:PPOX class probable F420-dependent enzyme
MAVSGLWELPGWALELLERSPRGHLSYLDDRDRPRVLPVTFAVSDGSLWTAIDQKPKRKPPARVRYLRRRPEAALGADHYEDDWSRLAWVQVIGSVEVVEVGAGDPERSAFDALRSKYVAYVEQPPAGPLLRLRPERVLCWRASEG